MSYEIKWLGMKEPETKHIIKECENSVFVYDKNEKEIYTETSDGFWSKREYDENNNQISYKTSNGYWSKWKYDKNDNEIYYKNSNEVKENNF
jgi:glucose dehydrogenase